MTKSPNGVLPFPSPNTRSSWYCMLQWDSLYSVCPAPYSPLASSTVLSPICLLEGSQREALHTFTFSILDVCKPGQPDRIRRHPSISASTCLLSWPTLGKLGHVLLRYHYQRNIGAMSPDTKQTPTSEQRHSRMLCALMLGRACRAPVLPKVPRSIFIWRMYPARCTIPSCHPGTTRGVKRVLSQSLIAILLLAAPPTPMPLPVRGRRRACRPSKSVHTHQEATSWFCAFSAHPSALTRLAHMLPSSQRQSKWVKSGPE